MLAATCMVVLVSLLFGLSPLPQPRTAKAGEGVWTTTGPYGGDILTLAVSPNYGADSTLYAGTGLNSVFKSANGAINWIQARVTLEGTLLTSGEAAVRALAFFPDDPTYQTILAGTGGGLYRSSDGGATWEPLHSHIRRRWCVPDSLPNVSAVAISPAYAQDSIIYAAVDSWATTQVGAICWKGLFKSDDGGRRWDRVDSAGDILAITLSPDYVSDRIVFVAGDEGVRRFFDEGDDLTETAEGLTDYEVPALAVSPNFTHDGTIFAGTSGTALSFGSETRDQRWTELSLSSQEIEAEWKPQRRRQVGGIFRSTDGGETWQPVSQGLTSLDIRSLAISPDFAADRTIFAGTGDGAFKSTDGGETWHAISEGLPEGFAVTSVALSPNFPTDGMVFAGTAGAGVYRSVNGGLRWMAASKGITDLPINRIAPSPGYLSDGTIFVATDFGGVYKTTNWARTWTAARTGLRDRSVKTVAVSPAYPMDRTVFAATASELYRSTNSGNLWVPIGVGLPPGWTVDTVAFSPAYASDRTVFVGSRSGGIFRSTDEGDHWTLLSNLAVSEIAVSPNYRNDHTLFIGTRWGVFRSADGGHNWRGHTAGMPFERIDALAISPGFATDRTIFAASYDPFWGIIPGIRGGIVRSTDGGITWTPLGEDVEGPFLKSVISLATSPHYPRDRTVLAGTGSYMSSFGFGVYRSTDGGDSLEAFNQGLPGRLPMARALAFSPGYLHDRTIFVGLNNSLWSYSLVNPTAVRTLILVQHERLLRFYGLEPTHLLLDRLQALASHPEVRGFVVDLSDEELDGVRQAYDVWDQDPTTANANAVSEAIKAEIAAHAERFPNLTYLVIVGNDLLIPFRRLPDTTHYPESHYLSVADIAPPGMLTTTVSTALADDVSLSDDYYGDLSDCEGPCLPHLAVGRLIETPEEIMGQLDAFTASSTINDSGRALIGGGPAYLLDAMQSISDTLRDRARLAATSLTDQDWTVASLHHQLLHSRHDVVALLGESAHDRVITNDGALSAAVIAAGPGSLRRALVLSLGDHSGLNVPDTSGVNTLDLPQALARQGALLVAPTGYAWAMRDTVGLSEEVALEFMRGLGGAPGVSVSVGQALRGAKVRTFLNSWAFDAYTAKAIHQLTLYGLPMVRFTTPVVPVGSKRAVARSANPGDVENASGRTLPSGLAVTSLRFTLSDFITHTVGSKRYYTYGPTGGVQATAGYPILPKLTFDALEGFEARGVLFLGGEYMTEILDPLIAAPLVAEDRSGGPVTDWSGWYPSRPQVLNAHAGRARLVMSLGAAYRLSASQAEERRFGQIRFEIFYSNADDRTAPTIHGVSHSLVDGRAEVTVRVSDEGVGLWRVGIVFTDGIGVWQAIELERRTEAIWTGTLPLAGHPVHYLVQAVDAAGNVTADDNGGRYYVVSR